MAARVKWDGLAELRAALLKLPETLAQEAQSIVVSAATTAADEIRAAYPVRTGNLRRRVSVKPESIGRFGVRMVVKNTAPHAALFEFGTQARHTKLGAFRGSMPPGKVFVPASIRQRRRMHERLKDMLREQGLIVTGDA